MISTLKIWGRFLWSSWGQTIGDQMAQSSWIVVQGVTMGSHAGPH